MKKFLLFISTVFLSLLFINNNVNAQEFPEVMLKAPFSEFYPEQTLEYVYEYTVEYYMEGVYITELNETEYYFTSVYSDQFTKGLSNLYNSYILEDIQAVRDEFGDQTLITLRVRVMNNIIDDYGDPYTDDVRPFFSDDSTLYVKYHTIPDSDEYNRGYNDGYNEGRDIGYNEGYNDGYNEGYDDGYNEFDVADYFGDRNIAEDIGIDYTLASDPFEPTTSIVVYNDGYSGPNILLDKQYIIVVIKKNIYDYVAVRFEDLLSYDYNATYLDIGDYDIYIFDFLDRLNTRYNLEIRKENVTTTEEANEFLNDVINNIYFSHASKLLTSSIALQFYDFGYLKGLEETLSDNEAYQIGYDNGYNRGYIDGNESGYNQGFDEGYDLGFEYGKSLEYKDGYDDGYNEGAKDSFISKLDVWIVPAIIIVVIAGIFVGYRRERYFND